MSVPLHYVDLRAFSYGTEDDDRVERALRELLPEDAAIERAVSTGHHGDRIVVMSARVERADQMRHVFDRLRQAALLEEIAESIGDRVNENNALFVHLDKQVAYRGEVRLGTGISLRAKIEAYPATREKALDNVRSLF
ncbi:MAG: RNA-binding protein [Halanaeroarchaeum sp.]